ncbi:MAG: hypothetical protein IKX22_04010 [Prevotella sp.]|nr:hypothetical protein [Prevotella sp.]
MDRHLGYGNFCAIISFLWGLLSFVSCDSNSHRAAMLAVLDGADSLNRSYIPITTDSILKDAVTFFDSHGTSNDRLRAHYLLGCAYRDMGEAPRAIEAWQEAAVCADTTAADCDYKTLGKTYSQMANLFFRQLLLSDGMAARQQAYRYTLLSKDTLVAIHEYKMMASSYLVQDKNDSAEIILSEAIRQYQRHGYLQEELEASTMLMYIYADQPSRMAALKRLIDRYEAECTLFDENHELPPSKRQYYYYKGRYYEYINQLDSAEFCYRKIFRPGMSYLSANPMYKGLLSVYQKKHISDSIARYADLYCLSIDSSSVLKDRELTAQMAASYNYNRYQKQAHENAEKANERLYVAVILLSLSILGIIAAVVFNQRYRKKRKELEELQREYAEALYNYNRTRERLEQVDEEYNHLLKSIHKGNAASESLTTMLSTKHEEEKEQLTRQLHSYTERVEQLERQLKISQYTRSSIPFFNLGIIKRIKMYAGDCQRQLNDNDLRTLADAVKDYFPDLITDMDGLPTITPLAKKVCLLTILNLKPGEIVNLLGISSSQVSNLRKDLNLALFNKNTTKSLYQNLSGRYKILSS